VAGEALVESEMSEQAKSRGEALLPVPKFFLDVVERGELGRKTV
jgi:hypothetical protein